MTHDKTTTSSGHGMLGSEQVTKQDAEVTETSSQPSSIPNDEPVWAQGFQLLTIMAALALVCFLMLLDSTIVVAAIPRITDAFNSLDDIGWYGAAYQLGSAVFQPVTGKLYMQFKPKWTFLAFFTIFEIGSLVCALATSSNMLIGGRVIASLGTSGIMNGAMLIIAECAPLQKRPALIDIVMGLSQLGLASGPLFGGLLTEYATLRWCFYLNLPIGGLVAVILVLIRVPQQFPRPPPISVVRTLHKSLDLLGFAIFAPAFVMLLRALQWGGITYPWSDSRIIGLFCGAGVTAIVWLIWNYHKGDAAMIPLSMLRQRIVWASCIVFGLFMSNLFTATYWVPVYFQGVKGVSPTMSGVYILPMILGHIFSAMLSGPIVNKVGYCIPVTLVSTALLAIGSGLLSTFSANTLTGQWIGYQILLGVGRGLGLQMPIIAVQNAIPPAQLPIAMGFIAFSQSFGGAVFLSLDQTIFSNSFKTLLAQYAPSVDSERVIAGGATAFRSFVSGSDLAGVLTAYAISIDRVFYLAVGMAVGSFAFAGGMGWQDLRKKPAPVSKA